MPHANERAAALTQHLTDVPVRECERNLNNAITFKLPDTCLLTSVFNKISSRIGATLGHATHSIFPGENRVQYVWHLQDRREVRLDCTIKGGLSITFCQFS